jgi:hypothetical protein
MSTSTVSAYTSNLGQPNVDYNAGEKVVNEITITGAKKLPTEPKGVVNTSALLCGYASYGYRTGGGNKQVTGLSFSLATPQAPIEPSDAKKGVSLEIKTYIVENGGKNSVEVGSMKATGVSITTEDGCSYSIYGQNGSTVDIAGPDKAHYGFDCKTATGGYFELSSK